MDFECSWMNVVVKAWRGEAIAVAVFAFIAMALYFGAALKSAGTSCMRTGGLVLMLLSMFLSAALAGSMMLINEGDWGEGCMPPIISALGVSTLANVPSFIRGKAMSFMCASFVLALCSTIAHCVTDAECVRKSAPEVPLGYQVYTAYGSIVVAFPSDHPAQQQPHGKVLVAE